MKIQPLSPALIALNQALADRPFKPLSAEAAQAQVLEHLAEAQVEFWKNPCFELFAPNKWESIPGFNQEPHNCGSSAL